LKSGSLGFNRSPNEQGREKAVKALENFLRPEFINRVDEIVYFNRLSEENFVSIAKLMLEELHTVMTEKKIEFNYDDALLQYLAKKSYSLTYGARNLRRLIQKEIEDCVATEIIDNFRGKVSSISLTAKDEKVQITVA
ncbi:MAG: ATP-dependent Clp protease ATP-binding subunit, partial [Oscillospiraceae bacterium]